MTHIFELFRILSTVFSDTVFYSRKAYLPHQYKKLLYQQWSYRITIDEIPIPLKRICVPSYLSLLLTEVLFETLFKLFQYNTKGRRLSNYSIKLILCSHYHSIYKGLCQNKKHGVDQYAKGGHFCAAHITLSEQRGTVNHSPIVKFQGHDRSKPGFYTPDYGHHVNWQTFDLHHN